MSELKQSAYKPKACLIGSRDQLCVNEAFKGKKGMTLNSMCKKARELSMRADSPGSCQYYKNTGENLTPNGHDWNQDDIEDLHKMGLYHKVCPYYM